MERIIPNPRVLSSPPSRKRPIVANFEYAVVGLREVAMNDVVRAQIGTRGPQLSTKRFGTVPGPQKQARRLFRSNLPLNSVGTINFRLCFSWSTLLLGTSCCKEKGIGRMGGRGWYIKVGYVRRAQMHYNCSQRAKFLAHSQSELTTTSGSHLGPTTLGN